MVKLLIQKKLHPKISKDKLFFADAGLFHAICICTVAGTGATGNFNQGSKSMSFEDQMRADAAAQQTPDRLQQVREAVLRQRDLLMIIEDLDGQLKDARESLFNLEHTTLPELFIQAGITKLGLEPHGNLPGYTANLEDYFRANIKTDWDEAQKKEAFAALGKRKLQDLIKHTIEIQFGLDETKLFKKTITALKKLKLGDRLAERQNVPWNTLTAWLKDFYKGGRSLSDKELQLYGATVGKRVKLKPVKDIP